jgi:hypothetical protein
MKQSARGFSSQAQALSKALAPLLAGHPPEVQGAALADLVSIYLTGFPNYTREDLLELHINTVRELLPYSEQQAFGPSGHPGNHQGRKQ